jgi:hypothetical protein
MACHLSARAHSIQFLIKLFRFFSEREISISQYVAFLCVPILFTIFIIIILSITFARQAGNSIVNVNSDRSEVYISCYDPNAVILHAK